VPGLKSLEEEGGLVRGERLRAEDVLPSLLYQLEFVGSALQLASCPGEVALPLEIRLRKARRRSKYVGLGLGGLILAFCPLDEGHGDVVKL